MNNIRRISVYFKKYKYLIMLAMAASAVVSGTDAFLAYLSKDILDEIFIAKNMEQLRLLPMLLMTLFAVRLAARFVQSYLIKYAAQKAIANIRYDMYHKIIRLPLAYFDQNPTGVMTAKIINDVKNLQNAVASVLNVFRSMLTVVFLTAVVFKQDAKMAMAVFIVLPLIIVVIKNSGRRIKTASNEALNELGNISGVVGEGLSGIRVVKSFSNEEKEFQRFRLFTLKELKHTLKQSLIASISSPLIETLAGFAVAGLIFYGGAQVISGDITAGAFFSFLTAFGLMFEPVKKINNYNSILQKANASAERIFSVLDAENDILAKNGDKECSAQGEDIRFENVTFSYSPSTPPVLSDITLDIKAGMNIAIAGSSGSGKSTLASLLPRFYDVQEGCIKIGGTDIREFDVYSLRKNISIVSQSTFLFNNTISYNIAYGVPDASQSDIEAAAEKAYALDFIKELPEGFNTYVGEKGVRLSGGQKQRISIARAILTNAPVLILDEATSALDSESEKIVQKALENLMKNRTSIVIAHRLSTIMNSDLIIVMDKGKIHAAGTHGQLSETSDIYSALCEAVRQHP